MDFGNAIKKLKDGKSLYRIGWNDKGICIRLMKTSDSQRKERSSLDGPSAS